MKGDLEDYWWIWAGAILLPFVLPMITGAMFPDIPESPCLENVTIECDEWSPECNINGTVEVVSGPFFDQSTELVEIHSKEVCVEYENGTRVMPR